MKIQEVAGPVSEDALYKARVDFVQRSFVNAQELNRFVDQKANFLLAAVALLTTGLGIVASKGIDATSDHAGYALVKGTALTFFLAYLVLAFLVIFYATKVFRVQGSLLKQSTTAPGLIYPLVLLQKFGGDNEAKEEAYLQGVLSLQPDDILRDYSDQIMQVSAIYSWKQAQINTSTRLFQWLTICWITSILLLAVTIIWR